jgi:hypothetical protein
MRTPTLLLLITMAMPAFASDRVTVQDLQKAVASARGKPDSRVAHSLSGLVLTERLTSARLAQLKAELPGEQSRLALLAVADASSFMSLDPADVPATAAPDRAAQHAMLAATAEYLAKTIPMLPDLYATQEKTQFADRPIRTSAITGKVSADKRFHLVTESVATVSFVAAKGDFQDGQAESNSQSAGAGQLAVHGAFGPIYAVVRNDVLPGNPVWSHWEQGPLGPMAVFSYQVPREKSHYVLQDSVAAGVLAPAAAYQGEIAVDPATGAVLRLTLQAAPTPGSLVIEADILVEYAPVELGGKSYICPLRSVAISRARAVDSWGAFSPSPSNAAPPLLTEMNDVAYTQYHLFRSQVRMLAPDSEPATEPSAPPPAHPPQSPHR